MDKASLSSSAALVSERSYADDYLICKAVGKFYLFIIKPGSK